MTTLRPSQVRARILREHATLRSRLDQLTRETAALQAGDERAVERALALSGELLELLGDHLDLEDRVLAPVLKDADSWGDIRAARLLQHHAEQREQLHGIARSSRTQQSPMALAALLDALIDDLRIDMDHEERSVLSTELLHDDLVTSGEGG